MKQTKIDTPSLSLKSTEQFAHTRAIVIGAGFGGLAAALRLQTAGFQVTLLEAREKAGGRAYQFKEQGFTFDMGPTLITLPHLLEQLWQLAGRDMYADLDLVKLSPFYRILFQDGRAFDYWGTTAQDEAEIAAFEPRDVEGYRRFLTRTRYIYERAFLDLAAQPFHSLGTFLRVIPELIGAGAQQNVYSFVSRYIRNPALRMVFSFHPLFIGGNPFRASAIYSIVPYLERLGGVHYARGGMYTVIEGMVRLFREAGGEIRYSAPVQRILVKDQRITGVELQDETVLAAPVVVTNGDVAQTYLQLLSAEHLPRFATTRIKHYRYSMSCFLLYLGLKRQYPHMRHHTIIMPAKYRELLREIFDGHGLPADLALYLHMPTRTDPSLAPAGGESLYILAPVPNLSHGIDWSTQRQPFRERILSFLEREVGLEGLAENIVVERCWTPLDFATELRSYQGAAFSIEPTLTQSAYFRPHNRSDTIEGLYFVGAGTHPGAGIPGVLLSADLTSRLIISDAKQRQWMKRR